MKRGRINPKRYEPFDVVVVGGGMAGTAAAMAAVRGRSPREVDVEALRSRLRAAGVLLEPQPEPSLLKRYGAVVSSV